MENGQDPNLGKNEVGLQEISKDLRKKMKESVDPFEVKEMFSELKGDSNLDKDISDLFYQSVETIFNIGYNLAKKLDFELIADFFQKDKDKKEEE